MVENSSCAEARECIKDLFGLVEPGETRETTCITFATEVDLNELPITSTATVKIVAITDQHGNTLDVSPVSPPTWSAEDATDSDLVTLAPAADGMSCQVTSGEKMGSLIVAVVVALANDVEIVGVLKIMVVAGEPAKVVLEMTINANALNS